MKLILYIALSILFIASTTLVFAQGGQTDGEKNTAKIASKIQKLKNPNSTRVKVTLYNGNKYEGSVRSSSTSDFVLVERSGTERIIAYSEVRSVSGTGLSKGAKIGIGVGAAAGATLLVIFLVFKHITKNN